MAAVPVTLVGVMTADGGSSFNCVFNGVASLSGLGVGGGPMPPGSDAHPEHPIAGPPPQIWPSPGHPAHPIVPPGGYPHPEHPIVLPPVEPGGPPIDVGAHPEHPIVLPPPPEPTQPPETVTVLKAPPPSGGWGAVSEYGWAYYPAQGEAQPKS